VISREATRLADVREARQRLGPETLQLNLVNRCNLDCVFCWNHSPLLPPRPPAWHAERLSDPHLAQLLAALPRLAPDHVLLSGRGEPLLHPGIEALLERLAELEIAVTIQTNGTVGPAPERLRELHVGRLHVDASAATAEGYARVHPRRGVELYPRLVKRLERLAQLGVELSLVAVIQRENLDEIVPLARWARALGARSLYLKGLELRAGLEPLEALVPDAAGWGRVVEQLGVARRLLSGSSVELDCAHLEQLARGAGPRRFTSTFDVPTKGPEDASGVPRRRCLIGWYYLRVTVDGRVMFCCKDKPVGHLDDPGGLYRLWRSPRYQALRLAARDGDAAGEILDSVCARCSNFARNRAIERALAEPSGRVDEA
jgi:MoaA/NifB/PqqE/SkfB family radical SAM enzyme